MNGAIAEPCVNTIRPPTSRSAITIGSSQNFFRSLINAQSSRTKSLISASPAFECSSELPGHVDRGSRELGNAIRRRARVETPLHRIMPAAPHDDANRHHQSIEDHGQKDMCIDPSEAFGRRHPGPVDMSQAARHYEGGDYQRHSERE